MVETMFESVRKLDKPYGFVRRQSFVIILCGINQMGLSIDNVMYYVM